MSNFVQVCPNCKHPMSMHTQLLGCRWITTVNDRGKHSSLRCVCPTTPEDLDVHPLTEDEL